MTDPRIGAAAVIIWLVLLAAGFLWLGGFHDNQYITFGFGPSDKLLYVGYSLNTWPRWGGMIVACIFDTMITIWACDTVYPWLNFNVFDEKNVAIKYSYWTTVCIAQAMNGFQNIRPLFTVYLAFTQIDIIMARALSDILISFYTLDVYLRQKQFGVATESMPPAYTPLNDMQS